MMNAPKLAQIRFQVRRSWSFGLSTLYPFGIPWTMEVIEPSSVCFVSTILFSVLEPQFRVKHVSQIRNAIFHLTLFRKFAIAWQAL